METLLRIGLSNAVVALVMAMVVVTVACVWRRPAVLHALWLLVLVKLVTPPLVWVRVPWPIIPEAPAVAVTATAESAPIEPLAEEEAAIVPDSDAMRETASVEGSNEPAVSETLPEALTPSEPLAIPNRKNATFVPVPGWMAVTCGVWLTGALAWYILALVRLRRFRQMLRHAVPAPESLRQRTQRLAEKLRLRCCPGIWLVPGRVAPMLWAAGGRPRILFPADLLKQVGVEQQNALLVHELAHLRRRDHWVRWLEFAAAGLYWWNPVLWFARRELREAEEQCCDAWVTSTLPGAGKTYATALLETLDFLSDAPPATPLLASGVGRVVDLKRRLTMIMRGTTPRTLGWRGAAAVVGLGALLLPLLPAWVQAQAPAKVEKVEEGVRQPRWKLTEIHIGSDEGLYTAGAELKQLEAELAQKQAEVAVLAARLGEARARVAARQSDEAVRGEWLKAVRPEAATADAANYDIVVKVNGDADYKTLQEFLKQIQALHVQGASPNVIMLDKISGKILMKAASGKTVGVNLTPASGTQPTGSPPADTDKRIMELETKLKSILNEVEQLRQERKPESPDAGSESKPHSYGPTPLERIPYVYQWFKQTDPAPMQEEKPKEAAAEMAKFVVEVKEVKGREAEAQRFADAAADQLAKALANDPQGQRARAIAAQLDAFRVQLDNARADWQKLIAEYQSSREAILKMTANDESLRKAYQATLKQLEEEIRKVKSAPASADSPAKP